MVRAQAACIHRKVGVCNSCDRAELLHALKGLEECAHCDSGRWPTCVGRYERPTNPWEPACDECCGHGNEDGECMPVAEYVAKLIRGVCR